MAAEREIRADFDRDTITVYPAYPVLGSGKLDLRGFGDLAKKIAG